MRIFITLSLIGLASVLSGYAQAQDNPVVPAPLVTVVGHLDPNFSVQVSPDDLRHISDGLSDLKALEPQVININDLVRDEDTLAIGKGAQHIADTFIDASKALIDMRVLTYKLSALDSLPEARSYNKPLGLAYNIKFKRDYDSLIGGFVATVDKLGTDAQFCLSELCVVELANAAKDFVRLIEAVNGGIKIGYVRPREFGFQSDLVKAALSQAAKGVSATASSGSGYAALVGGALLPFSNAAVSGNEDLGSELSGLAKGGCRVDVKLAAKPFSVNSSRLSRSIDVFAATNIREIVNNPKPRTDKVNAVLKGE